ncbi:hypothetical protein [Aquimonas voraii]|uniref:Uncharacterized protein n=1 Tax=Aquimonas voraii TaxID=265719 RepID=A0A1G6VFV3_9GAMM|nr:hypothetical protein [Aquimonas voraii]SDD52560.1 hypothetical protein SAMN04488509_10366 [Aquimonas voraii]
MNLSIPARLPRLPLICLLVLLGLGAAAHAQTPTPPPDPRWPLLPAEGLWMRPGAPGTALHLSRRGEQIAVSLFDFVDGQPVWRIGLGGMQGDALSVELLGFSNGSCIDCVPARAPQVDPPARQLRLRFASARRAWLSLDGRTELPLQAFAFGGVYASMGLADRADAEFGPLPFPQLCGTWALESELGGLTRFSLGAPGPRATDGSFSIPLRAAQTANPGELIVFACRPGLGAGTDAECRISDERVSPPFVYGSARLGDIEENRIRFNTWSGTVFYAHRLGEIPAECRAP